MLAAAVLAAVVLAAVVLAAVVAAIYGAGGVDAGDGGALRRWPLASQDALLSGAFGAHGSVSPQLSLAFFARLVPNRVLRPEMAPLEVAVLEVRGTRPGPTASWSAGALIRLVVLLPVTV